MASFAMSPDLRFDRSVSRTRLAGGTKGHNMESSYIAGSPRLVSGELQFRRQHPFGDHILDFVCLENKLVIEVDGGHHGQQAEHDKERTQKLQAAGFRILRFWNNEVLKDIESVEEKIWLVIQELQSHPPPNLPLERGGVRKVHLEGRGSKKVSPWQR